MAQVKQGDTVRIHYAIRAEDGITFESTFNNRPLRFEVGGGHVIVGLEKAILGMNPGEFKTVRLLEKEGYGPYLPNMTSQVPQSVFSPDLAPQPGEYLQVPQSKGTARLCTVLDVSTDSVTIDSNHPLAGKKLVLDLQLLEIVGQVEAGFLS